MTNRLPAERLIISGRTFDSPYERSEMAGIYGPYRSGAFSWAATAVVICSLFVIVLGIAWIKVAS